MNRGVSVVTVRTEDGVYDVVDDASGVVFGVARRVQTTTAGGIGWDAFMYWRGDDRPIGRWNSLALAARDVASANCRRKS